MTKQLMSRAQIYAAGYVIVQGRPIGSKLPPWRIMRHHPRGHESRFVLDRYDTRTAAVAALHDEMTDPDGVLRPAVQEA
jgi:hypothetical protein